jgi:DNA polymerase-3 subunit gamma/tau
MLSNSSFNALLKTLEEPPEDVKFILATTDPKKLPVTILSRCLQFHLKRITPEQIAAHMQHICQSENITNDKQSLDHLAKAADGSMRDALSLLDQAIAYGRGTVNQADVHAMLGSMSQDELLPLLNALAAQDSQQLFAAVAQLVEHAPDFQQVLEQLISLFHRIAIAQIVPQTAQQDTAILELANQFSPEDVQLYYQIALLGRRDLALAPSPQHGFEMTILRMLAFKPATITAAANLTPVTNAKPAKQTKAPEVKPAPAMTASANDWRSILPKLELNGMSYALASNCTLTTMSDTRVELALAINHQPMLNPKLKDRIAEALSRLFNKAIQLDIKITNDEIITPHKQQQQEQASQLSGAKQRLLEDPRVKQLIDMYDATLEVALVT